MRLGFYIFWSSSHIDNIYIDGTKTLIDKVEDNVF